MLIIGINAFHGDSSAALIKDGILVAAAEEERFRRVKHWAGFPVEAIRFCLNYAKTDLAGIDCIAINSDSNAHRYRKLFYVLAHHPSPALIYQRIKNRRQRSDIKDLLDELPGKFAGEIIPVEHHLAHLASAFYVSPFKDAIVASVDGFGDFASAAWGIGADNQIELDDRIYFPHSLGIFYEAITQYLGFPHYGDEYKVMGLAPYGKPVHLEEMQEIVKLNDDGSYALNLKYFRHAKEQVSYTWNNSVPEIGELFTDELSRLLGPKRKPQDELTTQHRNIAASVQAMYEKAFFHLLNSISEKLHYPKLALAGGCAMNSVANGKIYENTSFKKVYIQAAAGDAGGAIGAAFSAWYQANPQAERKFTMDHAYWGPRFSNKTIGEILQNNRAELESNHCQILLVENETLLCEKTAKIISEGKVVGWFQGAMEWGPRALGNRSIVCDPRRPDMKEILNDKIKRRESFRPFAPSILKEYVADWFEQDDDVPFMMKVFRIRSEKRQMIPAVTHVDGTGRLQTVTAETNSLYYRLINAFRKLTGVPMVLNTSFNENEPVVCKPEEALACFIRTRMDLLVMGNYMIQRIDGEQEQ